MGGERSPDIVFSLAGHDRGKAFVVLRIEKNRAYLVDGKTRKLVNPKEKSLKHIRFGGVVTPELASALAESTATDRLIRKELARFRGEVGMTEEVCQLVKR